MPIESAPEPNEEEKEETIVARILSQQQGKDDFARSWVMEEQRIIKQRDVGSWVNQANLDRLGRTQFHKDLEAARLAVSGNQTAARLCIGRDRYCYVSFTLVDPEVVSYLNLDCPDGQGFDTAYPFVRATDEDLVLFDIYAPRLVPDRGAPPELFVYTAAGPSPSVQRLPVYAKDNDRREVRGFLKGKFTTGILRLSEKRYIVADLSVLDGALCVFNSSKTKEWEIIPITPGLVHWHPPEQNQSRSGQLPNQWSTDDVLAFDGRFLCWVDYFSGVLLCDFTIGSPALHFVPFPGEKEYPAEVRVPRQFPGRFRSVSSSRGKMCFVHIDNDFHETIQDDWPCRQLPERTSQGQQHQVPPKITIWTLNPDEFKWEQGAVINLDLLWAQPRYKNFPQRLPEFPIFHAPDLLICLLREKEFDGMGFMIMVDMMHANLQSWTPYINRQFCCAECKYAVCGECVDDRKEFPNMLLLPTVFSRYIPKIYRYDIVERHGCSSSLKEA